MDQDIGYKAGNLPSIHNIQTREGHYLVVRHGLERVVFFVDTFESTVT